MKGAFLRTRQAHLISICLLIGVGCGETDSLVKELEDLEEEQEDLDEELERLEAELEEVNASLNTTSGLKNRKSNEAELGTASGNQANAGQTTGAHDSSGPKVWSSAFFRRSRESDPRQVAAIGD